ncbi:hypothetical protein DFH29DRAFT_813880, partial [Suillus ampliporus]
EHNFSGALATWKDIKLQELQKTLDAQGIEIVDNQKESVLGRKQLADRTKGSYAYVILHSVILNLL